MIKEGKVFMIRKVGWEEHGGRQKLLKRNRERRDWERQQQGKDKNWDKAFTVIFGIGCV